MRLFCPSVETSKDHLETKKQILAVRQRYGEDNWLSSHAGTFLQDIMGLQPSSYPILTPESTIKHLSSTDTMRSTPDSADLLTKNSSIRTNEDSESLMKENSEISDEKDDESKVLDEEENITEVPLIIDEASALTTVPETLYDPEEGIYKK